MPVDFETLKTHPGRNPEYEDGMKKRRSAQAHNRISPIEVVVPKQPNKYVPHIGAKQRAKLG